MRPLLYQAVFQVCSVAHLDTPHRPRPWDDLGDAGRAFGPPDDGLLEGSRLEAGVLVGGRDEENGPQEEEEVCGGLGVRGRGVWVACGSGPVVAPRGAY